MTQEIPIAPLAVEGRSRYILRKRTEVALTLVRNLIPESELKYAFIASLFIGDGEAWRMACLEETGHAVS